MPIKLSWTLLFLTCSSLLLSSRAQDEGAAQGSEDGAQPSEAAVPPQQYAQQQAFMHPLTNMPNAAEDVETSFFYPEHTDQKFPIGETVTVLCHFTNTAEHYPFNVTAIMGSLNSPFDFNFHVQNYSYKPLGVVVRPDEEFTFSYEFQLHPDLQPVEYALSHTIFYEDGSRGYSSTFFNQTIELYYPTDEFDIYTMGQLAFSLSCSLFVVGLMIWIFKSDTSSKRASVYASSGADDWEVDELDSGSKKKQ